MDLSNRPIQWLAITAVVGGGLWAALAFAPSSASVGGASRSPWAADPAAAPAEGALGQAPAAPSAAQPEGDRLLVVPESRPAPAAAQPAAVAAAPAPAAASAKARFAPPRLKATAPIVSVNDRAQTSAFMRAPAAVAGADLSGAEAASSPASRVVASRGEPAAAAVHYGVVDRASLMGRGAGPVYNFRGSRASRGSVRYGTQAPAAAPAAGAGSSDDDAQ